VDLVRRLAHVRQRRRPGALLLAGRALGEPAWIDAGTRTLDFLLERTFDDGRFAPVGNEGWLPRTATRRSTASSRSRRD
jgi:hypothetical protein